VHCSSNGDILPDILLPVLSGEDTK
jgi:hypothetical protein